MEARWSHAARAAKDGLHRQVQSRTTGRRQFGYKSKPMQPWFHKSHFLPQIALPCRLLDRRSVRAACPTVTMQKSSSRRLLSMIISPLTPTPHLRRRRHGTMVEGGPLVFGCTVAVRNCVCPWLGHPIHRFEPLPRPIPHGGANERDLI